MFTENDIVEFSNRGISVEKVESQLASLRDGFPFLDVISAATPEKGIKVLSTEAVKDSFDAYSSSKLRIAKFVPASGAASRMFKELYSSLDSGVLNETSSKFVSRIRDFAFYDPSLFSDCGAMELIGRTLDSGLGYGHKPKGVILFHRYTDEARTAFEEHLVEGALYARGYDGFVRLVVTVSPEHLQLFKDLYESVKEKYEKRYGVKYDVIFTLQSPSTDTVAADEDGNPFRKSDGSILFRPGGHGALIDNVGAVDSDIVVIKNIDNVVREDFIEQTVLWKKLLTGRLILSRRRTFEALSRLRKVASGANSFELEKVCVQLREYMENEYCVSIPDMPVNKMVQTLESKLDRPVRVCGMVRNQGEPGGGPFIVRDSDGCTSLQILESVQLNGNDPGTADLFAGGTHFNPVDLVCSLTREDGSKFDLKRYVDNSAGFISSKSFEGRKLKALELPGLWNGAMSDWNTIFVEVPLITFNPVKTVMDLLRPEHRG